jgi:hypothetical protein
MQIGLYTFGDLPHGRRDAPAAQQRLAEIIAAAKLADEAKAVLSAAGTLKD